MFYFADERIPIFWRAFDSRSHVRSYQLEHGENYLNALKKDLLKVDDIFTHIFDKYLINESIESNEVITGCKRMIIWQLINSLIDSINLEPNVLSEYIEKGIKYINKHLIQTKYFNQWIRTSICESLWPYFIDLLRTTPEAVQLFELLNESLNQLNNNNNDKKRKQIQSSNDQIMEPPQKRQRIV